MKIKFRMGDTARDGHGISENVYFEVNVRLSEIETAFTNSCTDTGVNFTAIASDYEEYVVGNDIIEKFNKYPSFRSWVKKRWNYFSDEEVDELIESWLDDVGYPLDEPSDLIDLLLWFCSLSLENLEWTKVDDTTPTFSHDLGYGLFSQLHSRKTAINMNTPDEYPVVLHMPNREGRGLGSKEPLYRASLAFTELTDDTAYIVKNRRKDGLTGKVTVLELRAEIKYANENYSFTRNPNPDGGGEIPPMTEKQIRDWVPGILGRLKNPQPI